MNDEDDIKIAALIVAAGRGLRAGGDLPKQYRMLGGRRVLTRTLDAFAAHPKIEHILVVIHPDDLDLYESAVSHAPAKLLPHTIGGANRAESVLKGLGALNADQATHVLIHDAARPFVSAATINAVIDGLTTNDAAAAAIPATDSMRMADSAGEFVQPVSRENVYRMQTPQGFRLRQIREILTSAEAAGRLADLTDDVSAAQAAGLTVGVAKGDPSNIKLTTAEDFEMAEALLNTPSKIRVGTGFDVHAFAEGDHVTLCGVSIPHSKGLSGHSDADVGLHALTDALLGAIASGDIGQHFPPTDPQWAGADSAIFLEHAMKLVRDAGYEISNLDITLICERPKIGPHAATMRARVAKICAIDIEAVSVKATTTERLGFCGREEGIAAQAAVSLIG